MARSRFAKLDPEKQEAILEAAAEEFADKGYEAASVNRIIERSGISKGALYYYFEDKADLFSTVMERAIQRVLEETGGLPEVEKLTADTFWDTLRTARERGIRYVRSNLWYIKLSRAFMRWREEGEIPAAAEPIYDFGRRWLRAYLARGQELGVVRTDLPLPMLETVTTAVNQAGDRWLLDHWEDYDEAELRELFLAQLDIVRDMLDAKHQGWES